MNKVVEARADANAVTPICKDAEYYNALLDGKLTLNRKTLDEIIFNAGYLRSLGLVSLFYSDESFLRLMTGTVLDLSKYKPEELTPKMVQQLVTQCLSKS